MLSRRTARAIAELYSERFEDSNVTHQSGIIQAKGLHSIPLYDFFFDRDKYPLWFSDKIRSLRHTYELKDFIMHLQVGQDVQVYMRPPLPGYRSRTEPPPHLQVESGHRLLLDLAQDLLNDLEKDTSVNDILRVQPKVDAVIKNLELDGYLFKNGRLLTPESEVLDTQEEAGLLVTLYNSLGLDNQTIVLNHLTLTEKHYQEGLWGDCISNARNFLEGVLQEIAMAHSLLVRNQPLGKGKYESAVDVRTYLQNANLLDVEECKALAAVFGALSDKGSHPYMAQRDQARLLRQLSLVLAQFVMLRFDGLLRGRLNSSSIGGTASASSN